MALTDEEKKERRRAYNKKWVDANKEKVAASQKRWREANMEKVAADQRKWNEENKEKVAASRKAYRERNRDKIKEYSSGYHKEYRKKNPDKVRKRDKESRERNKHKESHIEAHRARSKKQYEKMIADPVLHQQYKDKMALGRDNLSDKYIKTLFTKRCGLRFDDIPQSLIEAKRLELQMKRYFKEQKNEE